MASFDLVRSRFIPVRIIDTQSSDCVSLYDALTEAHKIGEVTADNPLQTAAIMQLLLALAVAAYQIDNKTTWLEIWHSRSFSTNNFEAYLNKPECVDKFDLISEKNPFYQCANFSTDKPSTLNRLVFDAASGNNTTLFAHDTDSQLPEFTAAQAARLLITAQAYSPGGGVASKAIVAGKEYVRPNLTHAQAFVGITYLLTGKNLFETLMLNIDFSPKELKPDDAPWWEKGDWNTILSSSEGNRARVAEPPKGFCDRLTWQSRLIRLIPEYDDLGELVFRTMYYTQGRAISVQTGHPLKADKLTKKEGWYPVTISVEKAGWRDLNTLIDYKSSGWRPPTAINTIQGLIERDRIENQVFVLSGAGVAADQAKLILWRQERYPIPSDLLSKDNAKTRLQEAINYAESKFVILISRVKDFCECYFSTSTDDNSTPSKPDSKDVNSLFAKINPSQNYWSCLETHFYPFLHELGDESTSDIALDNWNHCVTIEFEIALNIAKDALGEGERSIRAIGKEEVRYLYKHLRKQKKETKKRG